MNITRMDEFRSREAIKALEHLLYRAKAGELEGLAICVKPDHGPEEIVFTGIYRTNPGNAVNASMRMSWRLTQLQDDIDAASQ